MVINFFHLVLKNTENRFWKCVGALISTFRHFLLLFFSRKSHYFACFSGKVTIHRQLPGVTISRNVWSKNRFFFGPEKAQKPCRQASTKPITGLWSRNSNFRLWVPLKASTVIGSISGCNMKSFWLQLQNDLVEKTLKTNAIFVQLLTFRLWRQFWFHYLKYFGATIKNSWAPVPQPFPRVHCLLRSKGDEQRNSQKYSFGAACHLYLTTQKSLICTASAKT